MTHQELDLRALALLSYVPSVSIKRNTLTTDEGEAVLQAEDLIGSIPLDVVDVPGQTVAGIVAQSRMWSAAGGLSMIVIDYLQLMRHPKVGNGDRTDLGIAETTKALKALAKTLKIGVILLSQLNRDIEKRGGSGADAGWKGAIARPRMADLRDSGGIEADADKVMFPLRPLGDLLTEANKNEAQIDIVKFRAGQARAVDVAWDGPCMAFRAPSGVGPLGDDEML
jgi:replicative DNA helicase